MGLFRVAARRAPAAGPFGHIIILYHILEAAASIIFKKIIIFYLTFSGTCAYGVEFDFIIIPPSPDLVKQKQQEKNKKISEIFLAL